MRFANLKPRYLLWFAAFVMTVSSSLATPATAQVPLSAYMDKNGFIDVQALTCAQLAGTFQEDADYLAAWYSGWYNGLAQKHFAHVTRAKSGEHQVIVYCKQHPEMKVIQAIDVLFKNETK
jgi:HdeA/HdeB family